MARFPIKSLRVDGVFGDRDYKIVFDDSEKPATIIVGPNGTGKSTILSIYYLFITKQWSRLSDLDFSSATIDTRYGDNITIYSSNLLISNDRLKLPPSMSRHVSRLMQTDYFHLLSRKNALNKSDLARISKEANVPSYILSQIHSLAQREPSLFNSELIDVENRIDALNLGTVMYLPTFRRIEKDIKLEEVDDAQLPLRLRHSNHIELVKSGMRDVYDMIEGYLVNINARSRKSSSHAMQGFIKDMVQGKISDFSMNDLSYQDNNSIDRFVSSLDSDLFEDKDKTLLRDFIQRQQSKKPGKPRKDDQYMGYFVSKMMHVFSEAQSLERPVLEFIEVIDRYLMPNKRSVYDSATVSIQDLKHSRSVSLESMSSGEKQIFSIFTYLYFGNDENYIVLIDEPELSLSVPWQKSFLLDILDSNKCCQLLAVTHSPFIFDNELQNHVVDSMSIFNEQ
jgi:ABC-type lipoprotein export system ATPase subunit